MADTSQAELPPQTNGISDGLEDDERSKMRPADIDADVKEMERRKRVESIMNSRLFREELERIIEVQLRDGSGTSGLMQQISDMMGVSKNAGNVFKNSNCVVPINDIRGIEAMGYAKGEKILRCKLAAVYRLIDLYGWTQGSCTMITARLNQDEEHFLVNPYGMLFHEITASSLIKADMQGSVVEQGTTNFSVNLCSYSLHTAIHSARPDIKCIIHVHTPSVVAISALKCGLLPISQESVVIGEVSTHAYIGGVNDPEEKDKIARNLGPNNKVLLLTNQGAVCCGETIEEAFFNARNTVLASESQLKLMPVGIDNLVLLTDEIRKKMYDSAHKAPESTPRPDQPSIMEGKVERKWRVGGVEFEALMRMLDNAGFRTGYIYRHPLVKGEPPRPRNDVEVPPAVSSLGYLLEEEELYKQGLWKKLEGGRKGHDRSRWLNSPNVYQKVEILETGTPDPKKITKWVADGSPTHSSTPVKIDSALQFVPKNTNPKEFKKLQQQIKDYRRADKISAGPQSHILEGVTWEEARKMQDAGVTQTGDQVVLMGAASKGIIQRGYQHNATMYKSPYAKNPFDSITDEDIDEYKKVVEKKVKGEYDTDFSESEGLSSAQINKRISEIRSPTSAASETEEESRDEPQVLRIETKHAPKPSQPEVVLSDDQLDDVFIEELNTNTRAISTRMSQPPSARNSNTNSMRSRKVLKLAQLLPARVKTSCYRTNSYSGFPKGSYAVPNPQHFHIVRQTQIAPQMRPTLITILPETEVPKPSVKINIQTKCKRSLTVDIPMETLKDFIRPFAHALNMRSFHFSSNQSSQTAFVKTDIPHSPLDSKKDKQTSNIDPSSFEENIMQKLRKNLVDDIDSGNHESNSSSGNRSTLASSIEFLSMNSLGLHENNTRNEAPNEYEMHDFNESSGSISSNELLVPKLNLDFDRMDREEQILNYSGSIQEISSSEESDGIPYSVDLRSVPSSAEGVIPIDSSTLDPNKMIKTYGTFGSNFKSADLVVKTFGNNNDSEIIMLAKTNNTTPSNSSLDEEHKRLINDNTNFTVSKDNVENDMGGSDLSFKTAENSQASVTKTSADSLSKEKRSYIHKDVGSCGSNEYSEKSNLVGSDLSFRTAENSISSIERGDVDQSKNFVSNQHNVNNIYYGFEDDVHDEIEVNYPQHAAASKEKCLPNGVLESNTEINNSAETKSIMFGVKEEEETSEFIRNHTKLQEGIESCSTVQFKDVICKDVMLKIRNLSEMQQESEIISLFTATNIKEENIVDKDEIEGNLLYNVENKEENLDQDFGLPVDMAMGDVKNDDFKNGWSTEVKIEEECQYPLHFIEDKKEIKSVIKTEKREVHVIVPDLDIKQECTEDIFYDIQSAFIKRETEVDIQNYDVTGVKAESNIENNEFKCIHIKDEIIPDIDYIDIPDIVDVKEVGAYKHDSYNETDLVENDIAYIDQEIIIPEILVKEEVHIVKDVSLIEECKENCKDWKSVHEFGYVADCDNSMIVGKDGISKKCEENNNIIDKNGLIEEMYSIAVDENTQENVANKQHLQEFCAIQDKEVRKSNKKIGDNIKDEQVCNGNEDQVLLKEECKVNCEVRKSTYGHGYFADSKKYIIASENNLVKKCEESVRTNNKTDLNDANENYCIAIEENLEEQKEQEVNKDSLQGNKKDCGDLEVIYKSDHLEDCDSSVIIEDDVLKKCGKDLPYIIEDNEEIYSVLVDENERDTVANNQILEQSEVSAKQNEVGDKITDDRVGNHIKDEDVLLVEGRKEDCKNWKGGDKSDHFEDCDNSVIVVEGDRLKECEEFNVILDNSCLIESNERAFEENKQENVANEYLQKSKICGNDEFEKDAKIEDKSDSIIVIEDSDQNDLNNEKNGILKISNTTEEMNVNEHVEMNYQNHKETEQSNPVHGKKSNKKKRGSKRNKPSKKRMNSKIEEGIQQKTEQLNSVKNILKIEENSKNSEIINEEMNDIQDIEAQTSVIVILEDSVDNRSSNNSVDNHSCNNSPTSSNYEASNESSVLFPSVIENRQKFVEQNIIPESGTENLETTPQEEFLEQMTNLIVHYLLKNCLQDGRNIFVPELITDENVVKLFGKLENIYNEYFINSFTDNGKSELRIKLSDLVLKKIQLRNEEMLFTISEFLADLLDSFFTQLDSPTEKFDDFKFGIASKSTPEKTPLETQPNEEEVSLFQMKRLSSGNEFYWVTISKSPKCSAPNIPKKPFINVDDIPLRPPPDLKKSLITQRSLSPILEESKRRLCFDDDLKASDVETNLSNENLGKKEECLNNANLTELQTLEDAEVSRRSLNVIFEEELNPDLENYISGKLTDFKCIKGKDSKNPGVNLKSNTDSTNRILENNSKFLKECEGMYEGTEKTAETKVLVDEDFEFNVDGDYMSFEQPEINRVLVNEFRFFRSSTVNASSYVYSSNVSFSKPKSEYDHQGDKENEDDEGNWMGFDSAKF